MCKVVVAILVVIVVAGGVEAAPASASSSNHELNPRNRRSDDTSPMETLLQQHSQLLTQLTAKLAVVEAKEAKMEKQVAFTARSSQDPFNVATGHAIILDVVGTNVGNAFDRQTGIFTAPVGGIYAFHVTCMDRADANAAFAMMIMANGAAVAECYSESPSTLSEMSSAHAAVHLQAGQRVWTQSDRTEGARGGFWTTFGGYLVTADV